MKFGAYQSLGARAIGLASLALIISTSLSLAQGKDGGLNWLQGGSQLSEESGTLTIEGVVPEAVVLRAIQECPIWHQRDLSRQLGTMRRGTEVRVIALTDTDVYKVRGRAAHGDVSGWMRASDLASQDPDFVANLRALFERRKLVASLIAEGQIALGMTPEEVTASIGRPDSTTASINAGGRNETFSYITYDRVPQQETRRDQSGRLYTATIYVKVETGRLSIAFENGAVSGIEESEGAPLAGGNVRIVPQPIQFGL